MQKIYSSEYWKRFDSSIKYSQIGRFFMFINDLIKIQNRWNYLQPFLPREKTFFEIGTGRGYNIRFFKNRGYFTSGIELDEVYSQELSSYGVIKSSIEEYDPQKKFGIVSAIHVLEHLEKPETLLVKAKRLMNPTSILFLEVPNCGAEELLKADKSEYHLHHFSEKNLKSLLDAHNFTVLDIRIFSPIIFIDKGNLIIRLIKNLILISFYLLRINALKETENGMYLRVIAKLN